MQRLLCTVAAQIACLILFGTCPSIFTCAHDGASVQFLLQNFNKKKLEIIWWVIKVYYLYILNNKHYGTHTNKNQIKKSNLW